MLHTCILSSSFFRGVFSTPQLLHFLVLVVVIVLRGIIPGLVYVHHIDPSVRLCA